MEQMAPTAVIGVVSIPSGFRTDAGSAHARGQPHRPLMLVTGLPRSGTVPDWTNIGIRRGRKKGSGIGRAIAIGLKGTWANAFEAFEIPKVFAVQFVTSPHARHLILLVKYTSTDEYRQYIQ